jgi:hypothetical protein
MLRGCSERTAQARVSEGFLVSFHEVYAFLIWLHSELFMVTGQLSNIHLCTGGIDRL